MAAIAGCVWFVTFVPAWPVPAWPMPVVPMPACLVIAEVIAFGMVDLKVGVPVVVPANDPMTAHRQRDRHDAADPQQ